MIRPWFVATTLSIQTWPTSVNADKTNTTLDHIESSANQCWCGVVHLAKKWTARIFYQNATAKKYRTFFRLFDWNIATDTAKLSIENHVFQAFLSEFQAKFGLKYPNMSKLLEKTNHAREINLFCVTDVFYCDFVSSEPTRIQNREHVNKTGDVHFFYARKRRFLRYFFEKRIP